MSKIQIRKVRTSDLESLIKLISQDDMSPDNNLSTKQVEQVLSELKKNEYNERYVAELEGSVVGTFSLFIVQHISHNAAKSMIIDDVVVRTDLQGQGIGKTMINFAINRARDLGCYKISLTSGQKRTDAHIFYEKLGLKKHGFTFYLEIDS